MTTHGGDTVGCMGCYSLLRLRMNERTQRVSTRKCVAMALIFILGVQCALNIALQKAVSFGSKESDLNDIPQLSSVSNVSFDSPLSFSACLIFKDDIRILPEWLAYHYTVMPLRRLIVSIDPLSMTSPEPIFKKFRELGMDITVWDDIDFNEGKGAATPEDTSFKKRDAFVYRQQSFYQRCLCELKDNKLFSDTLENKPKWVFVSDIDEYIVFNNFFDKEDVAGNTKEKYIRSQLPKIGEMTVAQYISNQNQSDSSWGTNACTVIPRILFGSLENTTENAAFQVPAGFNHRSFNTIRFLHHQDPHRITVLGKSIVDVSRYDGQRPKGPHRLLNDCTPHAFPTVSESALRIHHYIGPFEFFLNKGEDAFTQRNKVVNESFSDGTIRGWLQAFVHIVGKEKALELTEGLREWAIDHFERISEEVKLGNFTYPFYNPLQPNVGCSV